MNANTTETAPVITVNMILDRYQRDGMDDLAPSTAKNYAYHIRHLRKAFGERIAADLKPRDFGPWLDVKRGEGLAHRVRGLAVLSAAFTMAVSRWYYLELNVLRQVKRPEFPPRRRLIQDAEYRALRAMAPFRMQLAMDLAVLTGQRQGDILDFKWSAIREEMVDGHKVSFLHVEQGKTKKRLAIEVTPDLERVLDECWMLLGGGKYGSEYVLPNRYGHRYTGAGFRQNWQKLRLKWEANGGRPLHYHDMRSLAATKCASLEEARMLLGHSSDTMTRRVYRMAVDKVRPLSMSVIQQ